MAPTWLIFSAENYAHIYEYDRDRFNTKHKTPEYSSIHRFQPLEGQQVLEKEIGTQPQALDIERNKLSDPTVEPCDPTEYTGEEKSPLERLLQSMSSDGQWTADDEREQQMGTSTSELRDAKAYYDPTKPDSHEPSVFGDDNGDEINVSPRKKQSDSDDNTRANFTPVMLYRFLFG